MAKILKIRTEGPGLTEITGDVNAVIAGAPAAAGVAHLFIQHTSASLIIQENADPDVRRDLIDWFDRAAPEGNFYAHASEGPDDMPAHIKSAITNVSLAAPFANRRLPLGTWQGIYLFEHRRGAHERRVAVTLIAALAD